MRLGGALTYYVDRDRGAIAYADGREQPGPHGRLCVKGRYGWDYAARGKRGRKPGGLVEYAEMLPHFREATWDEAGLGHPELPEPDLRQPGADRQAVPQPGSADGYIVIPDEATGLDAGSEVTVVLYA